MHSRIVRLVVCGLFVSGLFFGGTCRVAASSGSALWGPRADEPTLNVVDKDYILPESIISQCHDQDFVLRTANDEGYYLLYKDTTYTQCAYYTNFGLVSNGKILYLNNEPQPYHISISSIFGSAIPTPNAHSLFVQYGTSVAAYDNPQNDFKIGAGVDYMALHAAYEHEYYLKDGVAPRVLKDSNGHVIQDIKRTKISQNGNWLVFERGAQLYRTNADDFGNLLAFPGDPLFYGHNPNDDMTISNDGRYVATIANDHLSFKLYDLSTCVADKAYNLNTATGCNPVDMVPFLQHELGSSVNHVAYPQFSPDDKQLSITVSVGGHSELVVLRAAGAKGIFSQPTASNYIALGDSYASGEGAYDYFSGTDEAVNKCHLSKRSYPYLLGLQLQLDSAHSVACSGATMVNVNGYGVAAAQDTEKPYDGFSNYWLPGYDPQLQYIEANQPNIVTVSMVGNDVGFADIIKRCILFSDTCYASDEDRLGLVENINSKYDSLVAMYSQIKAAAAPSARIYVIGYPSIVKPDGNCGLNVHLNQKETEFASNLTAYLDYVIELAANKAGVQYVNTENAFDGSRLCDEQSADISAVNGLTAGNDTLHMIGQESYHPTGFGHQLLASTIAELTANMTTADPDPIWGIGKPDMLLASDYLHIADVGQSVPRMEFDNTEPDAPLLRGTTVSGSLPASLFHLDLSASYDVWLHSTPMKLGSVQSDRDGNVTYSFAIPGDIEPGWHTIDILGNDIGGDPVDIQRLVYVEASADDWDGDGVPNSKEPCGLIPAAGVDADHDGIDDACDGVIASTSPSPSDGTTTSTQSTPSDTLTTRSVLGAATTIAKDRETNVLGDSAVASTAQTLFENPSPLQPKSVDQSAPRYVAESSLDATHSTHDLSWVLGATVLFIVGAVLLAHQLQRRRY